MLAMEVGGPTAATRILDVADDVLLLSMNHLGHRVTPAKDACLGLIVCRLRRILAIIDSEVIAGL